MPRTPAARRPVVSPWQRCNFTLHSSARAGRAGAGTVGGMCDTGSGNTEQLCLRELVRHHRTREGLSAQQLAVRLGTERSTMLRWLCGGSFGPASVAALADELHVDAGEVRAAHAAPACHAVYDRRTQVSPYGQMVRDAVAAQGLSFNKLVTASGISRSALHAAVNGSRQPSAWQLRCVAEALDLDVVELAVAAGEKVDRDADRERLRLGMTRGAYAEHYGVDVTFLFGEREPKRPELAHRVAVASGCDPAAAAGAARRRLSRCPLGDLIEAGLDRHGWSTAGLARRAGVSRQTVRNWVEGANSPSPPRRAALAALLDVPVSDIDDAVARRVPPHLDTGRRLCDLRVAAGLLQTDLAEVLDIEPPMVSSLETGARPLLERHVRLLGERFGWDLAVAV